MNDNWTKIVGVINRYTPKVLALVAVVLFVFYLREVRFGLEWWGYLLPVALAVPVWLARAIYEKQKSQYRDILERKIELAEVRAEKEPEKAKFAWDLARVKLEAYFDRNLTQVNQVFLVAIFVMLVGFGFVLAGVVLAFKGKTPTSWVAAGSGIITQFIGATLMMIYRSTMAQANEFMQVLERINTVGMAIQVLDSIPEHQTELKNTTRAEIVSLLLNANMKAKATVKKKAKAATHNE